MNIIDVHAHIWKGKYEEDKAKIMQAVEKYGFNKVLVSALCSHTPDEDLVKEANQEVAKFVKEQPQNIGGYAYVSPEHKNALDVIKRGIEEQNMVGIKFWVSEFCDAKVVNPLAEKLIEYDVPVLIHTFKKYGGQIASESTAVNIRNLALRYPELKIIMAHIGGNGYHAVPLVRNLKNVWIDISGSIFRGNELNYTIKNVGVDRLLFGTDMPGSLLVSLGQVLEADISDSDKNKILSQNAEKLFKLNQGGAF